MIIRTIRHTIVAAAIAAIKTPRQPSNEGDRCALGRGAVYQGVRWIKIGTANDAELRQSVACSRAAVNRNSQNRVG
jgi:hypothetical protein